MADFFGKSQFGGHYFKAPAQGAPAPGFNPGFETLAPSQVSFSKGMGKGKGKGKGYTTEVSFSGGVAFSGGHRRKS